METLEKWVRIRIRLVGIVFLLVFGFIAVRAFCLQVLGEQQWQKRAERQQQRIIPLIPQRGTIYDRNGEEMALSIQVDSIYVEPPKVTDVAREALPLARGPRSAPEARCGPSSPPRKAFIWLKRQVSFNAKRPGAQPEAARDRLHQGASSLLPQLGSRRPG